MKNNSIILLLIMLSCTSSKENRESFVDKYKNEDFSSFKNYSLFVRDYDNNGGGPIILVYKNIDNCRYPYKVILEKDLKTVKETSTDLIVDSCVFNSDLVKQLAIKFAQYQVIRIKVDSDENVFLTLKGSENEYQLVRFFNEQQRLIFKRKLEGIKDQWYEIKN